MISALEKLMIASKNIINLIRWKSSFNSELQSQRKYSQSKYSQRNTCCYNILGHIRHQQQVGHRQDARDRPEATDFSNFYNSACFLCSYPKNNGSYCSWQDHKRTAHTCQLITVTNTKANIMKRCFRRIEICLSVGYFVLLLFLLLFLLNSHLKAKYVNLREDF